MIKSNKLRKDSCGLMTQLYDISTIKNDNFRSNKRTVWQSLFRNNCSPYDIDKYLRKIDFINEKQKEEVSILIRDSYSKVIESFSYLGMTRISGYMSTIWEYSGKSVVISIDSLYEKDGNIYAVVSKDKYRDRYKRKSHFGMGESKTTYEGYLACTQLSSDIAGIIYVDLHPYYEPKDDSIEEFILSHFSYYDLSFNSDLPPVEEVLNRCDRKDNCYFCKFKIFCANNKEKELIPLTASKETNTTLPFALTDAQSSFANSIAGVFRVNAVAGSGKTTCLAHRIVQLLKHNYKPEEILCISFTNNAVNEMKEKIAKYTSHEISERCNIYTFHGFCQKVLQDNYKIFGYRCMPRVATKVEKLKIINSVLDRIPKIDGLRYEEPLMNLRNAKGVLFEVYEYVDEYLKRGFLEDKTIEDKISLITNEMNKELINRNLIDLNSLISWVNDSSEILNYQYKHIMIDEAQDTTQIQFQIIKKISKYCISLSVVGDPNQSIFQWLYLDMDNLVKFSDDFDHVQDFYLKENFRTTKEIAALANKLICYGPKIEAFKNGEKPKFIQIESYSQINDIVKTHNSIDYGSIGIIARNKNLSDLLSVEFNSAAQYLYKNDLVISITKLAEYILFGTSPHCVLEYLKYTRQLDNSTPINEVKEKFFEKISDLENLKKSFECYGSKKQFFLYLLGFIRDEDKVLKNIDFDKFKDLEDIYNYLTDRIQFDDDATYITNNASNVIFTTAHSSKGSEYDTVILLLDKFNIDSDESIRLLYVAITRAKKNLYLIYKEPADKILNLFKD